MCKTCVYLVGQGIAMAITLIIKKTHHFFGATLTNIHHIKINNIWTQISYTGWPRKNTTPTINNFKKTRDRMKKLCALWRIEFFLLLLLLLLIWQSPGLPGSQKVNLITVTRRPLHPSIAAGLYCLTTSPGFLPALCEKWSGFFYVHRVWLSYTRDRRLKVSSESLGNEDNAPCPRALLPGRGSNRGPLVWKSEVLTARPRQLPARWHQDH